MTMFNARVDGARAENGKVIFDVDVGGQKSAPWTYKEFPKLSDLWGLNIHTSGEERDRIANAIFNYARDNNAAKQRAFELAQTQTILLSQNSPCLRCAESSISFAGKDRMRCSECGARYALASPAQALAGG
jgi:ribosomal protein S27AE